MRFRQLVTDDVTRWAAMQKADRESYFARGGRANPGRPGARENLRQLHALPVLAGRSSRVTATGAVAT